jgi:hypothetical protein
MPRFRLRSLVLLIAFVAMVLAIVGLTLENRRLQRQLLVEQSRAVLHRLQVEEARRVAELEVLRAQQALLEAQAKQAAGEK